MDLRFHEEESWFAQGSICAKDSAEMEIRIASYFGRRVGVTWKKGRQKGIRVEKQTAA